MNRSKEPPVSLCERSFVLDAIKENKVGEQSGSVLIQAEIPVHLRSQRLDGREVYDYRILQILPSAQPGSVEVQLGRTR